MATWTQTDRFETTMTASHHGFDLRIVGWVNCADDHATGQAYARFAEEEEVKIAEDFNVQSLDQAVRMACEAAVSYAEAAHVLKGIQGNVLAVAATGASTQQTVAKPSQLN